jgi:hypothetical protein
MVWSGALRRFVSGLRLAVLGATGVVLAAAAAPSALHASETAGFYKKWSWFENSYWIVPPEGVYSVFQIAENNSFVVDRGQTVFHITDYFNGYFTGAVVVKLTKAQYTSCQFVLGQVTPEGRVFMTMYKADEGSGDYGAVVNYPVGQMVMRGGEWTMVNQMTSKTEGGTLSHWAFMVQSKPGSASFKKLPIARVSIPEFMSSCPKGPKIKNPFE